MADTRSAPDTQDDPADAVTVHPGTSTTIPSRNDKRGILHMLHEEIGNALQIGTPKEPRVGTAGQGLSDAVNQGVKDAAGSDPDNP